MSLRMRPRFGLSVSLTPEQLVDRFHQGLAADALPCELNLLERQVEVSVKAADRHFWSPFLNVLIEPHDDGAVLEGQFGPNTNVWTLFLAAYAILSLLATLGLLIAFSQWQLGHSPTGLWLSLISLLLTSLVWAAGQVGQRLAHQQMLTIHVVVLDFLDDILVQDIHCDVCEHHDPRDMQKSPASRATHT